MRVVIDTNTLVSGIISANGPPRRLIDMAKGQSLQFFTSETLLAELHKVLARQKFAKRLEQAGLTPQYLVDDLRRIALVLFPPRGAAHRAQRPR